MTIQQINFKERFHAFGALVSSATLGSRHVTAITERAHGVEVMTVEGSYLVPWGNILVVHYV